MAEQGTGAAASPAPLLSEEEREAFLEFFAAERGRGVSIREACEHVMGLSAGATLARQHPQRRARRDLHSRFKQLIAREPDFAEAYRESRGYGNDDLRQLWVERAVTGYDEVTTIERGGVVETRTTRKVDNRMAALGLRAYLPEFGEHATAEVPTRGGAGHAQLEDRSAPLVDALLILERAGVLERLGVGVPRRELPTIEGVLAQPAERVGPADGVPDPE